MKAPVCRAETWDPAASSRNGPTNALSVDVEDYYQVSAFSAVIPREDWPRWPRRVEENTRRVLELLAKHRATATFFVLGCVAREHPRLVRAIVEAGHEVASHGDRHYRVWEQRPAEFAADVSDTKRRLEDLAGCAVLGYRAPSFSISEETWWAFDVLAETGHLYSSSVNPIRHDHYGLHSAPLSPFSPAPGFWEIPIGALEVGGCRIPCGGGGYFRLLPYKWSRWCLRRLSSEGRAGVFFFHPWEIDHEQPRVDGAPLRSRVRQYVRLAAMEAKLHRLLRDFGWSRIDNVFPVHSFPVGMSWSPRGVRGAGSLPQAAEAS